MKNLIYIIIGLVVVLGGGVYMWMQNEDKKMAEETQKAMADMGLPPGMLGSGGLPF